MNVFRWKRHHKKDHSRQKIKMDLFCFLLLLFSSYGKVSTFNGRINRLIMIHILHNNPNFCRSLRKNETKQSLTAVMFHPALRTTTMMMHEFYETWAARLSIRRRTSFSKCKLILLTVWRMRPHVTDTFPRAQCHGQERQRQRCSVQWWWGVEGGRGSIKGNTVYIWFWLGSRRPINIYLFMMRWKQRFNCAVPAAKDTVYPFKQLYTLTQIKLHMRRLWNAQFLWFIVYFEKRLKRVVSS